MSNPTFEDFINRKIEEEPYLAEQNKALLDLHKRGLIEVSYNSNIDDFDIRASVLGRTLFYCNVAGAFIPAEA